MKYNEKELKRLCINGEVESIRDYLGNFPEKHWLLRRYELRFFSEPPHFTYKTDNRLIRSILEVYYRYYILMFVAKKDAETGKKFLVDSFTKLFGFERKKTINAIESHIKRLLKQEGYYFLGRETSNFYGPYIWKNMHTRTYQVELPETTMKTRIHFMSDFLSNSWMDFLSFGKVGTGGWAKPGGLFCRYEVYRKKLDTPGFRISYLKHESQHMADYRRFGKILEPYEWEYRAKLTELVYYPTIKLFHGFLNSAKPDIRFTHSYAEHKLIGDLSARIFHEEYVSDPRRWETRFHEISPTSRELLLESSRELDKRMQGEKKALK